MPLTNHRRRHPTETSGGPSHFCWKASCALSLSRICPCFLICPLLLVLRFPLFISICSFPLGLACCWHHPWPGAVRLQDSRPSIVDSCVRLIRDTGATILGSLHIAAGPSPGCLEPSSFLVPRDLGTDRARERRAHRPSPIAHLLPPPPTPRNMGCCRPTPRPSQHKSPAAQRTVSRRPLHTLHTLHRVVPRIRRRRPGP